MCVLTIDLHLHLLYCKCTLHFALKAPHIICMSTSWSFPHSWFITRFVNRLTRQVPLVEQEIPTLPEHPSTPLVFSGVRVTRSLVLCVCFVDLCLSFCPFSFGHCVVCLSTIYRFRLPFNLFLQMMSKILFI